MPPLERLESRLLYSGTMFTDPAPGDTDGDYDIDDTDLGTAFVNYTGPVGAIGGKTKAQGDTDGDGDVDDTDLGTTFVGYTGPLEATPLISGATRSGSIVPFTEFDRHTIDADAGDKLFLSFYDSVNASSFDPGIFITNPDGTLLSSQDDRSAGATFGNLLLPQSGTYSVWVRDLGFNNGGDYALTPVLIDGQPIQGSTALTSGVTAGGSFSLGDIDTYTIQADAGDELFVALGELNTGLETDIFVYNPDGTLLSSAEDLSTGVSFPSQTVGQTGTYTIVVQDSGANETGGYNITAVVVDEAIDADNTALTSGVTAGGSFTIGDIDTFTIQADAVTNCSSAGRAEHRIRNRRHVFNPDGTLLTSIEDLSTGVSFPNQTVGRPAPTPSSSSTRANETADTTSRRRRRRGHRRRQHALTSGITAAAASRSATSTPSPSRPTPATNCSSRWAS
ncbi:MAG: PPC domain-containing protein [Phycisphaeraceae bacterium]